MSYINLEDLLAKWKLDEIETEHLHGQLLLWAVDKDKLLTALEIRSKNSNARLDAIEKEIGIKE